MGWDGFFLNPQIEERITTADLKSLDVLQSAVREGANGGVLTFYFSRGMSLFDVTWRRARQSKAPPTLL